jgi:serine/threonine-protein kinase
MSSTVAPEVILAGRYRLVRRLASGGMGQVWRANDEILGRPVAIKLLRSEYAEDPEFVDRFRAEARRTAALSHPGIASVFDYGETGDPDDQGTTAYLVMELVEGEPLSALLAREGRLSPAHTLDVLAQAALALDSAHLAGVVHRDVKPSNLLLRRDGVVKVTDFGIAHAADEAPRTEAGLVVGTAAYLSPEQVACRPATPASDVYALGVVTYECLAGRRPFTGEHPIALALAHRRSEPPPLPEDVPEAVCELVSWTMSKAPSARPHSAGALGRQALVARTTLDEEAEAGDPQTPPGGWFPVMSGWHPALGRGREPGDPEPGDPEPGDPDHAESASPSAATHDPGDSNDADSALLSAATQDPRPTSGAVPNGTPARAEGAPTGRGPGRGWRGSAAGPARGATGTGDANGWKAAAAGMPASVPARAERDAGAGRQAGGNGTARPGPGDGGDQANGDSAMRRQGDLRSAEGTRRSRRVAAERGDIAEEATGEWTPGPPLHGRAPAAPLDGRARRTPLDERAPMNGPAPGIPLESPPPGAPPEERAPRARAEEQAPGSPPEERAPKTRAEEQAPGSPPEERAPRAPIDERAPGGLPNDRAPAAPMEGWAAAASPEAGPSGTPLEERGPAIPPAQRPAKDLPAERRPAARRRRRGSAVAAVLAITALLAGGAMAVARQRAYSVVPSVDGQAITVAGQALTRAGFEVGERSRPDGTVRAGLVVSQHPAAGTRLNRGKLVTMVVSSGPPVVVLDPTRYLGRSLTLVRAAMIRLGLRVSVTGAPGRAGSGRVTAINPSGTLHQGDEVTVTVAIGRRRAVGA